MYELEALRPNQLQAIVREAMEQVIDIPLFNHEVAAEKQDATFLEATRKIVLRALRGQGVSEATDEEYAPSEQERRYAEDHLKALVQAGVVRDAQQ